jgi:two-component system, chemotaxis family, protein-glutamate methylesterase/glutaminase
MSAFASLARRIDAVVMGASAGGVDALCEILPAVPVHLRAPILIVLHLRRDRASLLPSIFAAKCRRPVREPMDKDPIEPGVVYVAPPDYHMLVDAGPQVALSADGLVNFSRPSIDVLFESAADFYGERLLGIILTGANEDGAVGLAAVHRAGGVTVVQEPEGAQAPFMVVSALKRTPADFVLPLAEIASLLRALEPAAGSAEGE